MDSADVVGRLKAQVEGLGGRAYPASELARLTASGGEPSVTPAAFVVPSGIVGGQHLGQTGAFVQSIERLYSVLLVLRSDTAGQKALDRIDTLIAAIIDAVTGWDGDGMPGLFVLKRCQLVPAFKGTMAWEFTFAIQDRIRKAT